MEKRKFEYDVENGTIMDFVEDHFMLVIKDDEWNDEEVALLEQESNLMFCYSQDIAIFVFEGGAIDSSDFYFNVQDCDYKDALFAQKNLDVEILLVNKENEICFTRRKTLSLQDSSLILDCLKKQNEVKFMPNEYEINVAGIQSAYEPFELEKFSKVAIKF